jgi:hypothetical protein
MFGEAKLLSSLQSNEHVFLENRIQKLNLKYNVKTSEVAKMIYISFGYENKQQYNANL